MCTGCTAEKSIFLIVTGIIFAGLSVLSFGILRAGFCHIYNDCMTALEKPYGLSLGRIAVKETAARPMQETIAVLFYCSSCDICSSSYCDLPAQYAGDTAFYSAAAYFIRIAGSSPGQLYIFFCVSATLLGVSALQGQKGGGTAVTDGFLFFMSDCTDGFGYCAPAGKL